MSCSSSLLYVLNLYMYIASNLFPEWALLRKLIDLKSKIGFKEEISNKQVHEILPFFSGYAYFLC